MRNFDKLRELVTKINEDGTASDLGKLPLVKLSSTRRKNGNYPFFTKSRRKGFFKKTRNIPGM